MSLAIRAERVGDEAAIAALIGEAFETAPHSSGTEAKIVAGLRDSAALTVSLVAEADRELVGHLAFSPVTIDGAELGWFGLGPIAVMPARQGQGIGAALIETGLAALRDRGAHGCVVLGDPDYYARFGFRADARLVFPGPPPQYFQALRLTDNGTSGAVAYHPAFG